MGDFKLTVTGGDKLENFLKKIDTTKGVTYDAEVGFFEKDIYDNGTPVAGVARANNFGLGVPQRPFFSLATFKFKRKKENIGKKLFTKKLTRQQKLKAVTKMAIILRNTIVKEITLGDFKPNAPSTIAAKTRGGEKNTPLIDTGLMRLSVNFEVKDTRK